MFHWNCSPSLFPFARPLIFVSFRASLVFAADQNLGLCVLGRSNLWEPTDFSPIARPAAIFCLDSTFRAWSRQTIGICTHQLNTSQPASVHFCFCFLFIYQYIMTHSRHKFTHFTNFCRTGLGINYLGGRIASPPHMARQQMLLAVTDLLGHNR